jgi:hypothetical protein
MVDLTQDLHMMKVSRVTLYDHFLDQWVERGQSRLIESKLTEEEQKYFGIFLKEGFSESAIEFVKNLAVAIFEHQDGNPVVEYLRNRDRSNWKHDFFGHDEGKGLLREACPLYQRGNKYGFNHRSILEYGLARAAFEPPSEADSEHKDFESLIDHVIEQEPTSPLCRRHFMNEPSVLQFLAERVQQEPKFKQELQTFIELSKTNEKWSVASANAITILVRAGIPFNGAELSNIKIRGADLSYGQFDSAQLQEADLRDVKLCNIWLRQANLNHSRMEGVEFGEWPYLNVDNAVYCCVYSPDGHTCAVGYSDGTIHIYDTASWTETHSWQAHPYVVTSVAYSPNGQQITSGGCEKTVRL